MEPLPAPPGSSRLAQRILIAAAAVQLLFFLLPLQPTLRALFKNPTRAQMDAGAIDGMDGYGYYVWLRSALVDGDWDFDNDYAIYHRKYPGPAWKARTPIGRQPNPWSVGPALVWATGVVPVHLVLDVLGARGEGAEDGYTPPYHLAVAGVTFTLALLTLWLGYATARRFAAPVPAAVAATGMVLGSSLLLYGTVIPGMAHGPAAALLAVYVFVWIRTFGQAGLGRWFALGILLGLASLMRWQLATFGILLALEGLSQAIGRGGRIGPWAGRVALAASGAVVGFVPQILAWYTVYGNPLVATHPYGNRLLNPALWQALFSWDHSFFYWTPITLVASLAGVHAVVRWRSRAVVPLAILLVGAAVQMYTVAGLLGGSVFLGASFGFRFLTETCVVLVPGLALLLDQTPPRATRWVTGIVCLLVVWNVLLVASFRVGVLAQGGPATPIELLQSAVTAFIRRPLEGIAEVLLIGWFVAVTVAGVRASTHRDPAVSLPGTRQAA